MSTVRTLSMLALLLSSPAVHGDPRGSLGLKAARFGIYRNEDDAQVWSESILLQWLESGNSGQVLVSVVPEGTHAQWKLPVAQKLISSEQANKIVKEAFSFRDAALSEAGPGPYAAGSKIKTWMAWQTLTATNYGANLEAGRSIPLDRAPKAEERFRKFIQDCAKK